MRNVARVLVIGSMLGFASSALAEGEFDVSLGYSHLSLSGSPRFEERDGFRFEPRVSFNPWQNLEPLRIGFGLGISSYYHELDKDATIIIGDGDEVTIVHADQWEALTLLEPEFQVSWRQPFADNHWYIEPGLGIGAVFANYGIVTEFWWSDEEHSEWDSTFEVRPFIRTGYRSGSAGYQWSVGGEVSYMFAGDVDLTPQVHGTLSEFYAGAYFGVIW